MDIFFAPIHLVHDTDWYLEHIEAVLQLLSLSIREFAKAANAATIALRRQLPLQAITCHSCGRHHCDEGKFCEWTTPLHTCPHCNFCQEDEVATVANPLAPLSPCLHPQTGRLILTIPPDSPDPPQFPPGFPQPPPPPSGTSQDSQGKGSISLGRGRPIGEATREDQHEDNYWN